MVEDSLEEVAHETLVSIMVDESLGHPVIGTKEHVKSFTYEKIKKFHNHFYHPKNIFLTMVGNLNEYDFESIALNNLADSVIILIRCTMLGIPLAQNLRKIA